MLGQPKLERGSDSPWRRAPRPGLLPGMGPTRAGGPGRAAQPRASPGISTTPIPPGQLRVIGEGRPLEPRILQAMQSCFEADFSCVRVHEGPAARAMGALAFTLGEELHFAPGLYDPTTREGLALLGHELTHVVQQREGRVANPYGHGVALVQDPALEAEADQMGQRVANASWSCLRVGQPMLASRRRLEPTTHAPRGGAARPASVPAQAAFWSALTSMMGFGGGGGDKDKKDEKDKKDTSQIASKRKKVAWVNWNMPVVLRVGSREAFFSGSQATHAVFRAGNVVYGLKGDLGGGEIAEDVQDAKKPYTWVERSVTLTAAEMTTFFEVAQTQAIHMQYTLFTHNCFTPVTAALVAVRDGMEADDGRRARINQMLEAYNSENFGLGQYTSSHTASDLTTIKKNN